MPSERSRTGSFFEAEDVDLIQNWLGRDPFLSTNRANQTARSRFNQRLYPLLMRWANGVAHLVDANCVSLESDILDERNSFRSALSARLCPAQNDESLGVAACYCLSISKAGFEVRVDISNFMDGQSTDISAMEEFEFLRAADFRRSVSLISVSNMFWIDVLIEWTAYQIELLTPLMKEVNDKLAEIRLRRA